MDTHLRERAHHPLDGLALDEGGLARPHGELEAHDEGVVGDVGDALHLQRLQELVLDLRILHHLLADLLGRLAQLLEVGVAGEAQVEFHRRPVAAEIGDLAELAERDGVDLAVLVAQPDGAQGEAFDRALGLAAIDVFADPEGIVGQVEDARHDVAHQRLAAERDREAEDRGAGDQRRDVDAHLREHDQDRENADDDSSATRISGISVARRDEPGSCSASSSCGAPAG